MFCHSLFALYLQYGSQLWGQANKENQKKIQMIQNRVLRKISFKKNLMILLHIYIKILNFKNFVTLFICKVASS